MAWETKYWKVEVRAPDRREPLTFPAGLVLPAELTWCRKDGPAGEGFDLEMDIVFDGTRYVCRSLRLEQREGGHPVTTEALREVPVKRMIKTALEWTMLEWSGPPEGVQVAKSQPRRPPADLAKGGMTDEALRWVVQIHELATVLGDPPTKGVQDELGISRATAGRWVAEARRRGMLPPVDEEGS